MKRNICTHRVQLVPTNDESYRHFCSHHADLNRSYAEKQPVSALQTLSLALEEAARNWLATHLTLSDARILAYQIRHPGRPSTHAYREIDIVEGSKDQPTRIFEFKVSKKPIKAISQADKQLDASLEVMRSRWGLVNRCAVVVDFCSPSSIPHYQGHLDDFLRLILDGAKGVILPYEMGEVLYLKHYPSPDPELWKQALLPQKFLQQSNQPSVVSAWSEQWHHSPFALGLHQRAC